MLKKILKFASQHKFIAAVIVLILVFGGYFGYKAIKGNNQQTRYVLANVEKGTLITSVSGSGQISASNQVDIKPKVSGDIVYINAKVGQEVKAGTLLVQLDTGDAQKAVRDAQINLENAQISLSKLKLNQETDVPKLQDAIDTAQNNLDQSYQNGFNEVANAFLDLPDTIDGIRGILYDNTVGLPDQKPNTGAYQDLVVGKSNSDIVTSMVNQALVDYSAAWDKYDKNLTDYRNATRYSPSDQVSSLIDETLETAKTMAQTVKDEQNLLDTVVSTLNQSSKRIPGAITQYQADISSYIGKLNSHITSLNNVHNAIISNQRSLEDSQRDLEVVQQTNPLDISSQENSVEQRQAALEDAQDALANYYIRAPFTGIIAEVNVEKGDSVSGGTAVATLITKQRVAEISLNEVDVAKVKVGQKTTLTFDAIGDLEITGEVAEIDSIGTVSQGVVSYNIKSGFDTQDDRVKPGMSVSASIIIDVKQNVLLIPNSAIKSQGNTYYVETLSGTASQNQATVNVSGITSNIAPSPQQIEIGSANDSYTEVTSGLKEGDTVITQTITGASSNSSTQQNNSFRMPGVTGGGVFRRDF